MNKTGLDRFNHIANSGQSGVAPAIRGSRGMRLSAAGGLMLGLTLGLNAQTTDGVSPAPKAPDTDVIVTPETVEAKAPQIEDNRPVDSTVPNVTADESAKLNTVLINALTGIVFTSIPEGAGQIEPVTGVSTSQDLPLLSSSAFQTKVASKYLGKQVTLANINLLNRDVVAFFKESGLPVVDVIVPEQDITAGTLRLIVLQGRLGKVRVEGNEWFSTEQISGEIRTASGEVLTAKKIVDDLNWLNQNPFRRVALEYTRGEEVGTTDMILKVDDRRPFRFYAGYEDSGSHATGINRYLAGFNWGNAFGLGHLMNYQFTTGDDYNDFYAHSVSYAVPLPWRHTLTVYGAYANSSAEVFAGLLTADGESYSSGLRYSVPLPGSNKVSHELFAGYDYKFSENVITFTMTPAQVKTTEISQFSLGYSANLRDSLGATSVTAVGYYSPGGAFSHNNNADFASSAPNASAEYYYGRMTLERLTKLPASFSLVNSVTAQFSSDNLLVSEQLGGGGYATVRGYGEREANAEEGYISRTEIRTPSMSVGGIFDLNIPSDQLQLLTFWDYAALYRREDNNAPTLPTSYFLSSAGVGLRYSVADYLSLRFDYGWQLRVTEFGEQGDSRGHISVVISY